MLEDSSDCRECDTVKLYHYVSLISRQSQIEKVTMIKMINLALFMVYQSQDILVRSIFVGTTLYTMLCHGFLFRDVFEDLKKPNKLTLPDDVNSKTTP